MFCEVREIFSVAFLLFCITLKSNTLTYKTQSHHTQSLKSVATDCLENSEYSLFQQLE